MMPKAKPSLLIGLSTKGPPEDKGDSSAFAELHKRFIAGGPDALDALRGLISLAEDSEEEAPASKPSLMEDD